MRRLTVIKFASLAALAATMLSVPATHGPTAAPALAKGKCGGHNQSACTWIERPFKPCNKGLLHVRPNNKTPGTCKRPMGPGDNATAYQPPVVHDDGFYNDHGGRTAIRLCNKSDTREIYAAIGYYDYGIYGDDENWSSAGWWALRRGECRDIRLIDDIEYGNPYKGSVYLMAVGGGLAWEGNSAAFCVDRDREFRIKNADLVRCSDDNTLYGVEFPVTPGKLNFFDFDG
ncbi:DUF1036 domain-containing protein [Altererythrobacter sp. MF3-039]|uniref:DUF1036 domain-containing protein n=1 Tax=Altererythrobacter sp. MF3-039 TaxID=3252901 RepID=UPI00390CB6FA